MPSREWRVQRQCQRLPFIEEQGSTIVGPLLFLCLGGTVFLVLLWCSLP